MHYTQLVHVVHHEHHCPEVICMQHKLCGEDCDTTQDTVPGQCMKAGGITDGISECRPRGGAARHLHVCPLAQG